jgi:hypothetical protein
MTVMVTTPEVEAALGEMRTMLAADGYSVAVKVGDKVGIEVVAGPEACADCLVPKQVMAGVVSGMLARGGVTVAESDIELTYPADS